jgi:hypothetical protein
MSGFDDSDEIADTGNLSGLRFGQSDEERAKTMGSGGGAMPIDQMGDTDLPAGPGQIYDNGKSNGGGQGLQDIRIGTGKELTPGQAAAALRPDGSIRSPHWGLYD